MNYRRKLKKIKALIFDVDGVFSNNFIVDSEANLDRTMNAKDGLAFKYAKQKGFYTAIITGGTSLSVKKRFDLLGIDDIYLGTLQKHKAIKEICEKHNLNTDEILYMGDDLPDYFAMQEVGFSACPADAANEIIEIADYVSDKKGGEGCVRDIIEQVMKVQNKWDINDFK